MASNRSWMYSRLINGLSNLEFLVNLEKFIEFTCSKLEWIDSNEIKCPCTLAKCRNRSYHQIDTVKYHLIKNGFIPGYYVWARQGEMEPNSIQNSGDAQPVSESNDSCLNVASPNACPGYLKIDNVSSFSSQFSSQTSLFWDTHLCLVCTCSSK